MPSLRTALASTVMVCLANAKTIKITATSDNFFNPESVTAEKDDVLEFHFHGKNHSVVAGDYQYPCSPMQLGTGFYSGFIATDGKEADKVFQVTVNSTEPIPFYSSQENECAKGMVGIVNPSSNKTFEDYKKRASELSKGVTPGAASFGGKLVHSDKADKKDDDKKDSPADEKQDSASKGEKDAAGSVRVPVVGLLSVVGLAFFLA